MSVPLMFPGPHNRYFLSKIKRDWPEYRNALPESVLEDIDKVLSLNDALADLYAKSLTYTRARQLLDQLPTFLRFMPSAIQNEMKKVNNRRAMRRDTTQLETSTVLLFALINLSTPMDSV